MQSKIFRRFSAGEVSGVAEEKRARAVTAIYCCGDYRRKQTSPTFHLKSSIYQPIMPEAKDKSKVHKLSIKGWSPVVQFQIPISQDNRIGEACVRIREY